MRKSKWRERGERARSRVGGDQSCFGIEALELRDLPATAFLKTATLMFIAGQGETNNVIVETSGGNIIVSDPGNLASTFSTPVSSIDSVMIQVGDKSDIVNLSNLRQPTYFVEVQGGDGEDLIIGSSGIDALLGNGGDDTIFGGEGNDFLFGGAGNDWMNGGTGDDRYIIEDVVSEDTIEDDGGIDTLDLSRIQKTVTVAYVPNFELPEGTVTSGTFDIDQIEKVVGGTSDDTILFADEASVAGGTGTLNGGGGVNTLDYSRYLTPSNVNLATGAATGTAGILNFQEAVGPNALPNVFVEGDNSGTTDPILDPRVVAITALSDYVHAPDPSFQFNLLDSQRGFVPGLGAYTAYSVNMISQMWLTPSEVNRTLWQHVATIIVPDRLLHDTALLIVDGGVNPAEPLAGPLLDAIAVGALQSDSVVIYLSTVPNQPLIFAGDPGNPRTEDQILAYSFRQYLETGQADWPVLVAMVKSAVKAMDVAQAFVPSVTRGARIHDFVVTGASKRGWTTWLTGGADPRVRGIIPMVIDVLNIEAQVEHIAEAYGFIPNALTPYRQQNVFSQFDRPIDKGLYRILDPINYVANINYPTMAINSTGDQFFITDAGQFYQSQIVGLGNYHVRYLPNTGHGLDIGDLLNSQAVETLLLTYRAILNDIPLPELSWVDQPDGTIVARTNDPRLLRVNLWEATNPYSRDLRINTFQNQLGIQTPWSIYQTIAPNGSGVYSANRPAPPAGATGYLMEFVFDSGLTDPFGLPLNFVLTTEARVASNQPAYQFDFGDAPASYGAASHAIDKLYVHLGTTFDAEFPPPALQQESPNALGDDNQIQLTIPTPLVREYDDEDGVLFVTPIAAGTTAQVNVVAASDGVLNAWVDFNRDGDFADAGEQIFTNRFLSTGSQTPSFTVPVSAVAGTSFARFRFSDGTTDVLGLPIGPTGEVRNGEVEDYQITIL